MPDECTPLMCEVNGNDFFLVSLSFFFEGGGVLQGGGVPPFCREGIG